MARASKAELILEAARGLLFERGIHATSMDDIAERASVSKMTIYKHFQTKDRLVAEVLWRYVREQHADMTKKIAAYPDPLDAMIHILEYREIDIPQRFLNECFAAYPHLLQEMVAYYDNYVAAEFEALIFDGQRKGRVRRDLSPYVITLYLHAMKEYLARPDVLEKITDYRVIGEQFRTLFLYGIAAPEARASDAPEAEGERNPHAHDSGGN